MKETLKFQGEVPAANGAQAFNVDKVIKATGLTMELWVLYTKLNLY